MQEESRARHEVCSCGTQDAIFPPGNFSVSSVTLCFTPSIVLHIFASDLFAKNQRNESHAEVQRLQRKTEDLTLRALRLCVRLLHLNYSQEFSRLSTPLNSCEFSYGPYASLEIDLAHDDELIAARCRFDRKVCAANLSQGPAAVVVFQLNQLRFRRL